VTSERALAVRAVGGVIAPLAIMDQGAEVGQVVAVLLDGTSNQLASLSGREGRTFF